MKKNYPIFATILLYFILLPMIAFSNITQSIKLIKINSLAHTNYVVSAKIYPDDPNHLFLTARGKQQEGDGGGIFIFDTTKPEEPKLVSQWQPTSIKGFTMSDNVMEGQDRLGNVFVSVSVDTAELYVFTVSPSDQLELKSWLTLQHTCFITCLVDKFRVLHVKLYKKANRLYALITSPQAGTLIAVDITNLDHPKEIDYTKLTFFPPVYRGAESISIHGEYAYVGAFHGHSLNVINLSELQAKDNPSLTLSNTIDNPYYDQMVSAKDPRAKYANFLYSASWSDHGGLIAFDLTNPKNPIELSSVLNDQLAKSNRVKINSDFAYLPLETNPGGIGIIDISNPYHLAFVNAITNIHDDAGNKIITPYTLAIAHDYLYLFGTADGSSNKMAIFKLAYKNS